MYFCYSESTFVFFIDIIFILLLLLLLSLSWQSQISWFLWMEQVTYRFVIFQAKLSLGSCAHSDFGMIPMVRSTIWMHANWTSGYACFLLTTRGTYWWPLVVWTLSCWYATEFLSQWNGKPWCPCSMQQYVGDRRILKSTWYLPLSHQSSGLPILYSVLGGLNCMLGS